MTVKNLDRLVKAFAHQGLDVTYADHVYSVRRHDSPDTPLAEVLLPDDFPVEARALEQLASLAEARHPNGGTVSRVYASPDFHPGDAGIAIGSVVEMQGQVIPAAVGSDINCGMRLHVADLTVDRFLSKRTEFVDAMKGDYFFGTRDVTMSAQAMSGLFLHGVPGWLDVMLDHPTGSVARSDVDQIAGEVDRIFLGGSCPGDLQWAPRDGVVRDGGLGTIGGGNHFVEVQVKELVLLTLTNPSLFLVRWGSHPICL